VKYDSSLFTIPAHDLSIQVAGLLDYVWRADPLLECELAWFGEHGLGGFEVWFVVVHLSWHEFLRHITSTTIATAMPNKEQLTAMNFRGLISQFSIQLILPGVAGSSKTSKYTSSGASLTISKTGLKAS
jgi:hypothetical protein